ncbi:MAG: flagellar basal body L-ring protein FlgH [Opitutales bacterium]|nr:flagellar basal body L-ring protein FlgH [Opitutales bacterium]
MPKTEAMKLKFFNFLIFALSTTGLGGILFAESLWHDNGPGARMFSDQKARQIGDIVTVVIQENSSVSASKSTDTDKTSSVDSELARILYDSSSFLRDGEGQLPGMGWSSNDNFSGGGSVSGEQSASAQLSAIVVDRQPNGNLIIEGVRRVVFNNETNYVVLRGAIRPTDVGSDNTILSSRIADAEIQLIDEGSLTEAQRKGWLNRAYDWINPF